MEAMVYLAGWALIPTLPIFLCARNGWHDPGELNIPQLRIFLVLWGMTMLLTLGFRAMLADRYAVDVWGTIIVGIIVGREIVEWMGGEPIS